MRPVARRFGFVHRRGVRGSGWGFVAVLWSACVEPERLEFPAGATEGARAVVWLIPDEAPIVLEVDEALRVSLPLEREGHRARALLYRCAPDALRIEARLALHGCLPPTQRQLLALPGDGLLQATLDRPTIPECGPCELWPVAVRHEIQLPAPEVSAEVGVVLPDGQILLSSHGPPTPLMRRLDPWSGSVTLITPAEGPDLGAFAPYWRDESGLYGVRGKSVWRIGLEGDRYRAERLTPPHPSPSYDRAATILRQAGQFYLASGFGGLLQTSDTSTSGWVWERDNWEAPQEPGLAVRTSLAGLPGDGLLAVGVAWEMEHYRPQGDDPPKLLGYFRDIGGRESWLPLPANQEVVSVVQDQGRTYLVSNFGDVYFVRPDGALEIRWTPDQGRNLRFAVAGAGRIWGAPNGGTYFPIYPEHGVACPQTAVNFGSLLLASETHLLHAAGPNLTVAEVQPIVECGLPQE